MKKQRKKLTDKQKAEIKEKIKKSSLFILHLTCYICTALFVLICVVGGVQSCKQKKQATNNKPQSNNAPQKALVQRASTIKDEAYDRYFYPSDVNVQIGDKVYLHLDFSNYNYLKYFMPSMTKYLHYNYTIFDYYQHEEGEGFFKYQLDYVGDNLGHNNGGFEYNGHVWTDLIFYAYDDYYTLSVENADTHDSYDDFLVFTRDDELVIDDYDFFDELFSGRHYFQIIRRNVPAGNTDVYYYTADFMAYYLSVKSFDFNGYIFGGTDKYVSFMNLFRRVYNGFFVYYPNHTDLFYTMSLFKGVWEYKNVIYNSIEITIQRAWNGTVSYNGQNVVYEANYYSPIEGLNWFHDIFSGDSEALTNYYFINKIEMVSVYGERLTLAYNKLLNIISPLEVTARVYPSNNIRLWADDSFLNNNNVKFVLYSIDYDYSFNLDNDLFIVYKYYSDFFFTAFYYTGLYGTSRPTDNGNTNVNIFSPVFNWFRGAFDGILPLMNAQLLPGVSIGALLFLPFIVSIILFVVKLFKR